jgi:hypothetical protein
MGSCLTLVIDWFVFHYWKTVEYPYKRLHLFFFFLNLSGLIRLLKVTEAPGMLTVHSCMDCKLLGFFLVIHVTSWPTYERNADICPVILMPL